MPTTINKEDLKFLYQKKFLTDQEIAQQYKIHKQTVYKLRKKFAINSISKNERFLLQVPDFTQKQKQIIFGTLMGDGHLTGPVENRSTRKSILEINHSINKYNQKDYIQWLWKELQPYSLSLKQRSNGKQLRLRTRSHPLLENLRNTTYKNNIKILDCKMLNLIDSLGLAVWYMDDGSSQGKGKTCKIATHNFTLTENSIIKNWFKIRWDLEAKLQHDNNKWFIRFNNEDTKKFMEIIRVHILPSMFYKMGIYQ